MLKKGENPSLKDPQFSEDWDNMTGDKKYDFLSKSYVSSENRIFSTKEIEETYKRRAQRWVDVLENRKPDRVPNFILPEGYIAKYAEISMKDAWYNSEKVLNSIKTFQKAFNMEYYSMPPFHSGKAFDILGLNTIKWPGSAIPEQTLRHGQSYQYVEGEYMLVEEYSRLINDPTEYMLSTYLPRICPNLKGLSSLYSLAGPTSIPGMFSFLKNIAMEPVKQGFKVLLKAADQLFCDILPALIGNIEITKQYGTPSTIGGTGITPFDIVGDTMRGTRGVIMDMYRCPDKLLEACKSLTAMAIQMATSELSVGMPPFVLITLHKGSDNFMSMEQFERFYWPSYKEFIIGILDEGMIPINFAEGSYDDRLDFLASKYTNGELPAGKTAWLFEKTDMKAAKAKIGKYACIGGNVPVSLFTAASAKKMEEYCRNLIETCAHDGGFFLAPGAVIMDAREENFRAYLSSTKKYGVYNTVTQQEDQLLASRF
jgi:uroporphyrinogen-III decarboxylase